MGNNKLIIFLIVITNFFILASCGNFDLTNDNSTKTHIDGGDNNTSDNHTDDGIIDGGDNNTSDNNTDDGIIDGGNSDEDVLLYNNTRLFKIGNIDETQNMYFAIHIKGTSNKNKFKQESGNSVFGSGEVYYPRDLTVIYNERPINIQFSHELVYQDFIKDGYSKITGWANESGSEMNLNLYVLHESFIIPSTNVISFKSLVVVDKTKVAFMGSNPDFYRCGITGGHNDLEFNYSNIGYDPAKHKNIVLFTLEISDDYCKNKKYKVIQDGFLYK